LHWLLKHLKARNIKDQFDHRFTSVPPYPGIRQFSEPFDSLKTGTWHGKGIRGMLRTLAVKCSPIHVCSKDDGKTAAEIACDEMVIEVVQVLCEFSLPFSQQNQSDLSLTALDDTHKRFNQKKGIFREQKILISVKAKVDDLLATESP
jgi:hypothetical protein